MSTTTTSVAPMALEWEILLECMALLDSGGPTGEDLIWAKSEEVTRALCVDADVWQFANHSMRKEIQTQEAVTKVIARGIAILSFSPGGVRFCDKRYDCSSGACDYYDDPAPGKSSKAVTFPLNVDDRYSYSLERGVTGKLGLFLTEVNPHA